MDLRQARKYLTTASTPCRGSGEVLECDARGSRHHLGGERFTSLNVHNSGCAGRTGTSRVEPDHDGRQTPCVRRGSRSSTADREELPWRPPGVSTRSGGRPSKRGSRIARIRALAPLANQRRFEQDAQAGVTCRSGRQRKCGPRVRTSIDELLQLNVRGNARDRMGR